MIRKITIGLIVLLYLIIGNAVAEIHQENATMHPRSASTVNGSIAGSSFGSSSAIWKRTIDVLVKEPLWSERDSYDASHVLMVPMHYAFVTGDAHGIEDFGTLMNSFAYQPIVGNQLEIAQWMYLVSRWLALHVEFKRPLSDVDKYLVQRVGAWLEQCWLLAPGFQWGDRPYIGEQARVNAILNGEISKSPSYYSAVNDYELFLVAIASDLAIVMNHDPAIVKVMPDGVHKTIDSIVKTGIEILNFRGSFTSDGGWLFQVGVWRDHPDFAYAGNLRLLPNLRKKKIEDIAEDSSHSHRWPLWLRSMMTATQSIPEYSKNLKKIYCGFSRQFVKHVAVVTNQGVELKNFMDGSNGVYRYKYETDGVNGQLGIGPYSASGVLGESWYPFAEGVSSVFDAYARSYPLNKMMVKLYVGPNTTRARNPLFAWPNFFVDGFAKMIAEQGAYLSKEWTVSCDSNA